MRREQPAAFARADNVLGRELPSALAPDPIVVSNWLLHPMWIPRTNRATPSAARRQAAEVRLARRLSGSASRQIVLGECLSADGLLKVPLGRSPPESASRQNGAAF